MQYKLMELMQENNLNNSFMGCLISKTAKQFSKKKKGIIPFNQDEMFIIANYFKVKIDDVFFLIVRQNGDNNEEE